MSNNLDGIVYIFRLSYSSEFGQTVAKEYLKCFDFTGRTLDVALRQFLLNFSLTGESQERDRVIVHFSDRFYECNPASLPDSGRTCPCNPPWGFTVCVSGVNMKYE